MNPSWLRFDDVEGVKRENLANTLRAIAAAQHRATHEPSLKSRPFGWVSAIAGRGL